MTVCTLTAALALAGCTAPEPGAGQQPEAGATASSAVPSKNLAPLRAYTPEQIVQVLGELRDSKDAKPAQVLGNDAILAQSEVNSKLQSALTPEVSPESCAPFINFAPTLEEGLTMGTAMFAAADVQLVVTAVVDSDNGHSKRAEGNIAALEQCGDITLKLAGQEFKLSMRSMPIASEAENSIAVRGDGEGAGAEMHMVNLNANTGSVLVSGAAISTVDFDEAAVLQDLAAMVQDALDRFENLPEVRTPNAAASAAPSSTGAALSSVAAAQLRKEAAGSWSGPVTGDSSVYGVKALIRETAAGLTADVEYPELRCKATWKETAVSGPAISLVESLESGRCLDNVKVTLTMNGDALQATFDGGTGEKIRAVLQR
ncbi:MAG: hypothetical protein ABWY04_10130 [Arthrobacter sp.]